VTDYATSHGATNEPTLMGGDPAHTDNFSGPITPDTPLAYSDGTAVSRVADYSWPDRRRSLGPVWLASLILALAAAVAVGAFVLGRSIGVTHNGAPAPTAQPAPLAPRALVKSPDDLFTTELAQHGISDYGYGAFRQMFMAVGHMACYQIWPPTSQSLTAMANQVTVTVQYNATQNPDAPPLSFTEDKSENLVRAAIHVFCPEFDHLLPH
jgi:Protein of unknown function (DUF732)